MVKKMTEIQAITVGKRTELRISFDNDRHHMTCFDEGDSRDLIASKLKQFAWHLSCDEHLDS